MSDAPVDFARFGRQVALPEIGADGQRRLGSTAVRFEPDGPMLREAHERAGGRVASDAVIVVAVPDASSRLVAAWASVEAARRVLDQPARPLPEGLLARSSA